MHAISASKPTIVFYGEVKYSPKELKSVFEWGAPDTVKIPVKYKTYIECIYLDITKGNVSMDLPMIFKCIMALYAVRAHNVLCPKFISKYAGKFVDSPEYYNNGHFLYMLWISECINVMKLIVDRPQYNPNDKPFEYLYFYKYEKIAKKALKWLRAQPSYGRYGIDHPSYDSKKHRFIIKVAADAPAIVFSKIEGRLYKIINSIHNMDIKSSCLRHVYTRSVALI